MSKIHVLTQDLINKIAAGEVVERPASAVKELVENAIDAGATEITLNIENGGLTKIEVIDNGSGMDESDAKLALQQHATSKIKSETDLEDIITLGFRGEALASIASVSDTEIHSFDGNGTPVLSTVKNGNIECTIGKGRAKGTTVTVNNIFSKVPARRKFLKSPATEYKYILGTFISIALSHPLLGFKLIKDGKTQLLLSKDDTAINRIIKLFPTYTQTDFIEIFYDNPSIKIGGFIGHPSKARMDNTMQYTFINNRFVKDQLIGRAVKDGFSSTLMNHNYPVYFLYFTIDNSKVDVNIHPRKLEVRYSDPSSVFMATKIAVEKSLSNALKRELMERTEIPHSKNGINFAASAPKPSIKDGLEFTQKLFDFNLSVSQPNMPVEQLAHEPVNALYGNTFQIFNTYIIFEKQDKVLVIDQHAADERVNYEKLTKRFAQSPKLEPADLLIPIDILLSPTQIETIKINTKKLKDLGFKVATSGSKAHIEAIPSIFKGQLSDDAFIELIADLEAENASSSTINKATKKQDRLIATMACHSSIRAGTKLSQEEMNQLLVNLFACELPYSCPHGRPIIWELTKYELEKNFKRKI